MKRLLCLSLILLCGWSSYAQVVNDMEYDNVDFFFDSLYSVKLLEYNAEQEARKLELLYEKLNKTIEIGDEVTLLELKASTIYSLPQDIVLLKNVEAVRFVDCENLDLTDAFEKLAEMPKLKYLEISYSKILSLPDNIAKLKNLESLNIKQNKLVRLPNTLTELSNLKTIDVSNNSLLNEDIFFELISPMVNLKDVRANYCRIRDLPSTSKNMDYLEIQGNLFSTLPEGLNVKSLNLSANKLMNVDLVLTALQSSNSLEKLAMNDCDLRTLPAQIGLLSGLKELYLNNNLIAEIPDEIGNVKSLQLISLRHSEASSAKVKLSKLPASVDKLSNLQHLDLHNNSIQNLPGDFAKLSNLKHLDLGWNQLEGFPKEILSLTKLEYLNLALNNVVEIPEEIGKLSALKYLDASGNFFVNYKMKIKVIPATLGNCIYLESLILRDNVIEELPSEIGNLKQLEILDLKDNLLSSLPSSLASLTSLKHLDLKANELVSLPENFANLTKLQHLNLAFNFNLNAADLSGKVGKMKWLRHVDITDCYLEEALVNELKKALSETSFATKEIRE